MSGRRGARILIVVAAAVTLVAAPWNTPASAVLPGDVPIQPGAPMMDPRGLYVGGDNFCTLNFVFTEQAPNPRTYIGAASSCASHVGERARSPELGAFGTVVYEEEQIAVGFALIEIDRDKLQHVSRVVRGFGAAPTGYTTSHGTTAGDPLVTHGYPYASQHGAQAVTRVGVLGGDTETHYWSSIQPNIQETGSPVVRLDGKAVGISNELSAFWGTWLPEAPPVAQFPTVEGILSSRRSAGFNVTL
ncbi:MAG TPA: hypothetical protein VNE62_12780 [Actinomycetota bacterium]|nr:hypothetical protein [Actinomycetota bacterium]